VENIGSCALSTRMAYWQHTVAATMWEAVRSVTGYKHAADFAVQVQ
jgi:hypothetical protein